MRIAVAALLFAASCSAPPPTTTPAPTKPAPAPTTELAAPPTPTQGPSPDADLPAVRAGLVGTWETTVSFPGGKSATQTLVFNDDGSYVQTDSGTEKATKTSNGRFEVVDGKPLKFSLMLSLADVKTVKTWQLLDASHLTTHAGMSDIVYVKKLSP